MRFAVGLVETVSGEAGVGENGPDVGVERNLCRQNVRRLGGGAGSGGLQAAPTDDKSANGQQRDRHERF